MVSENERVHESLFDLDLLRDDDSENDFYSDSRSVGDCRGEKVIQTVNMNVDLQIRQCALTSNKMMKSMLETETTFNSLSGNT